MFEWLTKEIRCIKTQRFFMTHIESLDAKARPELPWPQLDPWPADPPPDYRQFLVEHGRSFLFRENDNWVIRLFERPLKLEIHGGVRMVSFGGGTLNGGAYFAEESLGTGKPCPVFEAWGPCRPHVTANSFEEWLIAKYHSRRRKYSKRAWERILKGPPPFSEREANIVRARRDFRWKLLGVNERGHLQFEITNNSQMTLPYLSLGIRAANLLGGVWLPVSNIAPGETAIVEHEGYATLVDPTTQEVYDYADPAPEDRERYWEFGDNVPLH